MTRENVVGRLLDAILKREGWPIFTDRPSDKGGPTKGGITLRTLSDYRGRECRVDELKALDIVTAQNIYIERYVLQWSRILDDRLFEVLVDYAVTSWHDNPARALQQKLGLPVDGIPGPQTIHATNEYRYPEELRLYVLGHRLRELVDLAVLDPQLVTFTKQHPTLQIHNLRGWIQRVSSQL